MSDQGKWFKLWVNALTDPTLEELDTEQWFRWVRLGVFIKAHGEAGELTFASPGRALQNLLRIDNLLDMIKCIKKLPGYAIEENVTPSSPTPSLNSITETSQFTVKCKNWHKYQGDFSVKRTRKWRARSTVTGDGKSDDLRGEEKRREEKREEEINIPPIVPKGTDKILEWFENTWKAYPKERRVGKKAALRSYQKAVKDVDSAREVARALDNYLASKTVQDGFIKNASTFFANWEDYKNDQRGSSERIHGEAINERSSVRTPGDGIQTPAADAMLSKLADSKTFPR